MPTLDPSTAAAIARGVYRLREDSVATVADRGQRLGCEDFFTVDDGSRFTATSGGLAWKQLTGFGFVAFGKGPYQGEMLIATRGTAIGVDWLSNLNIGMQIGPGSLPVHAGFNEVWKSFAPAIRAFLTNRNPSRIHCIGHSLGGALATLNADLLTAGSIAPVTLYTFGAPRSGGHFYANSLTKRLGPDHVYRVSNPADPVPMIPLFPFSHLPFNKPGLAIANQTGSLISIKAHSMEPSYIPGVAGQSWATMAEGAKVSDADTKSWLESAAEGRGNILMGAASVLTMIGRALTWILKKVGGLIVAALGSTLAVGATVLDQIAWLLFQGASLSVEVATWVKGPMKAIFRFLGRAADVAKDLTTAFLRWVLDLLFQSLRGVATLAIEAVR